MLGFSIFAALPDVTDGDGSVEYIRNMKESVSALLVCACVCLCVCVCVKKTLQSFEKKENRKNRKKTT